MIVKIGNAVCGMLEKGFSAWYIVYFISDEISFRK
jgi:hypothetical protein